MQTTDSATNRSTRPGGLELHRVVVFDVPDDPHELRDLLVERLGLNRTDAQIHVHALPGVLPDRLPQNIAAGLATAIRELGVNAMAISDEDVPDLNHPRIIHHARCRDDGFEILDVRGDRERLIDWNNVRLVSIGVVPQDAPQHTEPSKLVVVSASPHHHDEHTTLTPLYGPEALIVADQPFCVLKIEHGHMNYEYLGKRLTPSATSNFRHFAQDFVGAVSDAYITPSARAFLSRGLFRHYQFRSAEEHKRYALFHLIIRNSALRPTTDGDHTQDTPSQ